MFQGSWYHLGLTRASRIACHSANCQFCPQAPSRYGCPMQAQTTRRLRQIHRYVGVFFTPAILFISLSGALQTLGLHENHGGGAQPATWIRWMASVHKDQKLLPSEPNGPSSEATHQHHGPNHDGEDSGPSSVPLKAFVVLLAVGLAVSSILGMVIALNTPSARRMSAIMFALGVAVPVALLFI
jgi:hypothetical protein